jgi:lysozyme
LPLLAGAAVLWCAWLAWQYRDAIAAKINARAPRAAAFLRSF